MQEAEDSKIVYIEDLCFYFLRTTGTAKANSIVALTEVNENSSKSPLLFPGEFLSSGSIGEVGDSKEYVKELKQIKNFQGESIVCPKYGNLIENLEWIKRLDPQNPIIQMKEEFAAKQKDSQAPSIGFLMEELMINPYLRLSDPHFRTLLELQDESEILGKIKGFETIHKDSKRLSGKGGCS